MIKRILVTGKFGQLGQSMQKLAQEYPQFDFQFVGRDELDLSQPELVKQKLSHYQFDALINCAAYTAVDKAETEQELADAINHHSVGQLAQVAKDNNALLIHISTDYVFDGQNYKPYQTSDAVKPVNTYGDSKLKGEQAIHTASPSALIIRTSWVYSEFGHNFVKTMLKLGQEREQLNIVADQVGSPTYATDLAVAILEALCCISNQPEEGDSVKIYHFSNEGICSWYDFAKAIFELKEIDCAVNPIGTQDYPAPAKRPHYSVMDKTNIKQAFGISIPYWKDSLAVCLKGLEKQHAK
ncbi:MAG: dTDP-4-dehydrorhamnose reductase [Thiopseudomonas sp.]|nr:dTDP-4-dehydrorhamnose reductase [Thiopseudomonas sp.]MCK9464747.1 dTDP-4-dehydrorhamnose reductase [Thiopseudomonas sp.]